MKGGIFILTLKADFNKLALESGKPGFFTSGSVNAYKVKFEFSEEWEQLRAIPVFKAGDILVNPDLSISEEWEEGGICTIPWEIFKEENIGKRIYAGLIGMNADNYVVTTVYAFIGHVFEGASRGDAGQAATPSVIQQLFAETENLKERLEDAEGLLEGLAGASPYDYAAQNGYSGTEDEFKADLAGIGQYLSKAESFANGNLIAFDADGNAKDSGKSAADFAQSEHTHNEYAPLVSPAFTGTPAAPTAAAGTSTTQIATTEFVQNAVIGAGGGENLFIAEYNKTSVEDIYSAVMSYGKVPVLKFGPNMYSGYSRTGGSHNFFTVRGTAASPIFERKICAPDGSWSQESALLAVKASPAFTGTPTAPTAAAGTSTTQIATTEFVQNTVGGMHSISTDGDWTVRKQSDGFFEAWYTKTESSADVKNQKGSLYESDHLTIGLPSGISPVDYDKLSVQLNVSEAQFASWSNIYGISASGIEYSVLSTSNRGLQAHYRVSIYVAGYTN